MIVTLFISVNTVNSANNIEGLKNVSTNPVKLILCWEWSYMKVVCQSIDSNLTDENFAYSYAGINTMIISADAMYGALPPNERPILVIPNGSFLAGICYANLYPNVNIVMCYLKGSTMSSSYSPDDTLPANLMYIAGGNVLNDWTSGSRFDFIDSTVIQYVESDLTPRYQYPISNIIKNRDGTAKIYNPIITLQTRMGWLVWLNISIPGISQNEPATTRSMVLSVHPDSGYIVVNNAERFPDEFIGGSLKVHWLSGSVTAAAVKISQIMEGRNCSFYEAKLCARMTASNNGVRNNKSGYGHINVGAAIVYKLTASRPTEL
ncbi:MAG: hypothetical protein ABI792_04670 [bacterium]